MRSYEAVFIFRTDESDVESGKAFAKAEMEKAGFTVTKEIDMGERDLAYAVDKHKRGHYHLFEIDGETELVDTLSRAFQLKPEIIKFLFTRK